MIRLRIATLLLLLSPLTTWADDRPLTYDRINLSVSAGQEVDNDTLVSVLYAQEEGNDPSLLSQEVNRTVTAAVDKAKRNPAIKVQTLDYNTHPIYRNQALSGWRVRQSIRLESRNAAELSQLIGDLQKQLGVSSISYAISPERKQESEETLIAQAIASFRKRAQMIAQQMGRNGYRLVNMNVNTSDIAPRTRPVRAMAMQAEAAPPTLEAGSRRVEVNINGTIELKP